VALLGEVGAAAAREVLGGRLAVVFVHELDVGPLLQLGVGEAERALPGRVELLEVPVEAGDGQHVHGQGEEAVAPGLGLDAVLGRGQRGAVLLLLEQAHLLGLGLDLLRLLEEVHEDEHLRAQDLRHHRRLDEVHRPERVAARDHRVVVAERGEEDDRRLLRALALADQGGGLEAVHARHVDVEQDHREVGLQQLLQRLAARGGLHQVLAEVAQDRLEREQLVRAVVDEQDVDLLALVAARSGPVRHQATFRYSRSSQSTTS
jgi:hypothetical protein